MQSITSVSHTLKALARCVPSPVSYRHRCAHDIAALLQYKLSKVITIAPRFLLRNESKRIVKIRQFRTQNYLDIKPGDRVPWHAFNTSAPTQFSFALDNGDVRWSVGWTRRGLPAEGG